MELDQAVTHYMTDLYANYDKIAAGNVIDACIKEENWNRLKKTNIEVNDMRKILMKQSKNKAVGVD